MTYIQKSSWIVEVKFSELLKSDSLKKAAPGSPNELQKSCRIHFLPLTPILQGVTTLLASNNCRFVFACFQTLYKWSQTGCTIFVWLIWLRLFVRLILVWIGRNDSFFSLPSSVPLGEYVTTFLSIWCTFELLPCFFVVVVMKRSRARERSNTRFCSVCTRMHAMGLYFGVKLLSRRVWIRSPFAGTLQSFAQVIVTIYTPSDSVSSGCSTSLPKLGVCPSWSF